MSLTYKLNRICPVCGTKISDKNKSGFCNRHRDRTGKNNSFLENIILKKQLFK